MNLKKYFYFLFLISITFFTACKDNDGGPENMGNHEEILKNIAENVITATYKNMADSAKILLNEVKNLKSTPTIENLIKTRIAWRATRTPWEQSEGFLFGPVDTRGIDPSLDSWPVNVTDLNNVLASSDALTKTYVNGLEGTLKGFHTIEYLLWGTNDDKKIQEFTARQYEYMIACCEVLADDTEKLYKEWDAEGGNFAINLINAGEQGSIYISQKSALEELVNGMIAIADEVANGKINDPLEQQDLRLEESQFSNNSKADFANNIHSIRNIYLGDYKSEGKGIADIFMEKNPALHTEILNEIDGSIAEIEKIPGTFSDAVFNNKEAVRNAREKIRNLQQSLQEKILPAINQL